MDQRDHWRRVATDFYTIYCPDRVGEIDFIDFNYPVRDVRIEETMNSVAVGGKRITMERVFVDRHAKHQGSSKPAEFAPNASQVLLDRCGGTADNVWYAATGNGVWSAGLSTNFDFASCRIPEKKLPDDCGELIMLLPKD